MKACALLAVVLALICAIDPAASQGLPGQTYSSLAPPKYLVELSYNISGSVTDRVPCTSSAANSTCIPLIQAASGDSIKIKYFVNTTYTVNSTATVTLKGCYSTESAKNRAWRKANNVIAEDKQCSVKIATGLPPQGEFTYTPGPNSVPAVFNILAIAVCEDSAYCAMGKSPGYFQIQEIDSRPAWLLTISGIFAAIGPVCLILFFVGENYIKKRK